MIKVHWVRRVGDMASWVSDTYCEGSSYGSCILSQATWKRIYVLIQVLRIHDILVWIRMRIRNRGSRPLTNGSGSGSWYFRQWPSRRQQEVLLLINFWRHIYIIFQREKFMNKSQNRRNQCFSYYFCLMKEGSGCVSWRPKNLWIRIRNTCWFWLENTDGEKSKPAEHCAGGSLPRSCSSLLIRFSAMLHNLTILKQQQNFINTNVADPDSG